MSRYVVVVAAALAWAMPSPAATWGESLFDALSKDFGPVPRGPMLSHPFHVTNNTGQTVHIASARVSCGCVSVGIGQHTLAPGESTAVHAYMDTRRFHGPKSVTIYVTLTQPRWEEVRLWVRANCRGDFAVTPDTLTLGKAKRGSTPASQVQITFAGGSGWQIQDVERESGYIETTFKEVRRDATEVSYLVTASIRSDTPVGSWYSDIWLSTNNPSMPKIRVPLTVEVEPSLTLSPSALDLGPITAGGEGERKVIIRGTQPFRVTKIEGTDGELAVQDDTSESKLVHILTVKLKPHQAGPWQRTIKVLTDLQDEGEIAFQAKAQVQPAAQN